MLFGILSKFIVLIIGFVDRRFFILFLGESLLGINGLFSNILLVLSLAELGLTNVMVYSYYKPLASKDYKKLSSLTKFYKNIYNIIAITVAGIGVMLIPFLRFIIKLDQPIDNLVGIYLIFLANTVLSYLFVYKSSILTADQNGYLVTKVQMKMDVLRQLCQIIVLILTHSIIWYLLVKLAFVLCNNLILMRTVNKKYKTIDIKNAKNISKEEKREILDTIKSGFIYKFAGVLLNGTDNILISTLVGTILVGYVANYDTVIIAITGLVTVFFGSMTASLGNLNVSATPQKKKEVFDIMLYFSFCIVLVVIPCCYCLMDDFIKVWLGEKYILDKSILIVKLAMMYLSCTLNPIFSFREATALFKKTKYVIFSGSIVNVVLSIVLGKIMGLVGILLASIIAMLVTYVWYEPVIIYKYHFECSPIEYFKKHIRVILILVFNTAVVSKCMTFFVVSGWISLWIKGICCFVFVLIMAFVCQRNMKEYAELKQRAMYIKDKFVKKVN